MSHLNLPWRASGGVVRDSKGFTVAECDVEQDRKAAEERAKLIAAAPELLVALQALHVICRDCDAENDNEPPSEEQYCAAMDAAEAVIAKATGDAA
jgi:hypothetical protein